MGDRVEIINGFSSEEWTGKWSLVRRKGDNRPTTHSGSFAQLEKTLKSTSNLRRKNGPAIIGSVFKRVKHPEFKRRGLWRLKEAVEKIYCVGLDIDKGVKDLDSFLKKIPWACFVWTTWSHGLKEDPCFRLLFPLSHAISSEEYAVLWKWLNRFLKEKIDPSCKDASRLYFLLRGKNPNSEEFPFFQTVHGEVLNPYALPGNYSISAALQRKKKLEELKKKKREKVAPQAFSGVKAYFLGALRNACDKISSSQPGQRNTTLNRETYFLGQWVGGGFLDEKEVITKVTQAGIACGLPFKEVNRTVSAALSAGKKKPKNSLPSTFRDYSKEKIQNKRSYSYTPKKKSRQVQKYLPDISLEKKLTTIRAGLSSGKTYQASRWRKKAESYLYVTARVSLTQNAAERLGLSHYQEEGVYEKYLAVCINSVHLIEGPPAGYEVIVIDEVEQVLSQMHSSITRFPTETYKSLRNLVRKAKHVVIMDANLSHQSIQTMQEIIGLEDSTEIETINFKGRTLFNKVVKYPSHESLTIKILEYARKDKRGVVACTAAADAKAISEKIAALGKKVLVYHRDIEDEIKETLGQVNKYWSDYDWVVYSPTVSSGVSFDPEYFDTVFLMAKSIEGIGYTDLLQKCHRVRNPREKTLHCWVDICIYRKETDFDKICQIDHDKIQWSRWVCDATYAIDPLAPCYARAKHRATQIGRIRSNNVQKSFFKHWQKLNVEIKEAEDLSDQAKKDIRDDIREIKKQLRELDVQSVLDAKTISKEELAQFRINPPQTLTERLQYKKAECLEFYGDINENLLSKDRSTVVRLVNLGLWETGHVKNLKRRDSHSFALGHPTQCKHETAQTQSLVYLLEKAGIYLPDLIEPLMEGSEPLYSPKERPCLKETKFFKEKKIGYRDSGAGYEVFEWTSDYLIECGFVEAVKRMESLMPLHERFDGWKVYTASDFEENPNPLLGRLLKALGIKTSSRRRRVDGVQIRFYSIDIESLIEQICISERHNRKRRGLEVKEVLESIYDETLEKDLEDLDHDETHYTESCGEWPCLDEVDRLFESIYFAWKDWITLNDKEDIPHGEDFLWDQAVRILGQPHKKLNQPNREVTFLSPSDFAFEAYGSDDLFGEEDYDL